MDCKYTKSYEEMHKSLEFIKGKFGYLFYNRSEFA